MAGGGVWMPSNERLAMLREAIAEHPGRLQRVLKGRAFRAAFGGLWDGHTLKRPPAGYSADTPLIDVIKLKSFIVEREREVGPPGEMRAWIT